MKAGNGLERDGKEEDEECWWVRYIMDHEYRFFHGGR